MIRCTCASTICAAIRMKPRNGCSPTCRTWTRREADKEKAKIVLAGLITRREDLEKEQQALEAKGC